MARTLFDCVGDWFEEVILREIPDLKRSRDLTGTVPDFTGHFYAEAKTGYWDYGAQLKGAQIDNFEPNGKPLVYIIGYHNTPGLRESTKRMAEQDIDALLASQVGLHSGYFVSNSLIKKIWAKEKHAAASNPDWEYFSVRPRHLDAIIHNKAFERAGTRHMPSRWYRVQRPKLLLQPAPLLSGRTTKLKFGTILDKKEDRAVIEYLRDHNLIV